MSEHEQAVAAAWDGRGVWSRASDAAAAHLVGRPVAIKDPTRGYDDRVLLTESKAYTVVEVPPVGFTFTEPSYRLGVGEAVTAAIAGMRDRDLTIRAVHAPADTAAHEQRVLDTARLEGTPAAALEEHLAAGRALIEATAPWTKRVFYEVELGKRGGGARVAAGAAARGDVLAPVPGREMARWGAEADRVRARLGRSALRAQPVGARTLRELRRRAIERGVLREDGGAGGGGGGGRGGGAGGGAGGRGFPGPRWVRVEGPSGVKFVATLVLRAFPTRMPFPATPPWLGVLDRLREDDGHGRRVPFTVDADLRLHLRGVPRAIEDLRKRGGLAKEQLREASRGGEVPDDEVIEMAALARALGHELPLRKQPLAYGWARVRVDAPSLEQLDARCEAVTELLSEVAGTGIDTTRPPGMAQARLLVEGAPGLPVTYRSFKQRWTLPVVGCALPQAGSVLGDPAGAHRGFTTGRQVRSVGWEMHRPIKKTAAGGVQRASGVVSLGDARSGKSGTFGSGFTDETLAGRWVTLFDAAPNAPHVRLAGIPRLAGLVDVVDLSEAGGGAVDPMGPLLIPDEGVRGSKEWAAVRRRRVQLTRDVVAQLAFTTLGADAAKETGTDVLLAAEKVADGSDPSMGALVEALRGAGTLASRNLAAALRFDLAGDDAASLLGEGGRELAVSGRRSRIVTMRELSTSLPAPEARRAEWTPAETIAATTFTCALYAMRRDVFAHEGLGSLMCDEAHSALAQPAGRALIRDVHKHGPKLGKVLWAGTHNAADFVDPRMRGGVSTWLLFRASDDEELAASHAAAGLADTPSLRANRRGLDNGECIAVFADGTVDRFQWSRDHVPGLAEATNTTPGAER